MSGVGGGVTMTIALRDPERNLVIEGHMVAPMGVRPEHYPIAERQPDPAVIPGGWSVSFFDQPVVEGLVNVIGARAIAVPGAVAALVRSPPAARPPPVAPACCSPPSSWPATASA